MENPLNHFIRDAKEIRLSDGAMARIRERLVAHMRAHPITDAPLSSPYARVIGILSPFGARIPRSAVLLPIAFLVVFGGAATYASGGALPGDALYAMKVNVVEPMKGLFTFSTEAEALWKVSLAERRLSEIEELAEKEPITPEEGREGQERFDLSLSAARETIEMLSKKNPEAATRLDESFTATLDKHEKILTTLGDSTSTKSAAEIHLFAKHVRSQIGIAAKEPEGPSASATLMLTATTSASSTPAATSTEEGEVQGQATTTEPDGQEQKATSTDDNGGLIDIRMSVPHKPE